MHVRIHPHEGEKARAARGEGKAEGERMERDPDKMQNNTVRASRPHGRFIAFETSFLTSYNRHVAVIPVEEAHSGLHQHI